MTHTPTAAPAQESMPNDWKLPADLKAGHVTFRKGVHCSALVTRMEYLFEAAFGKDTLTPEQKAENLAALQSGKEMPHHFTSAAQQEQQEAPSAQIAALEQRVRELEGDVVDLKGDRDSWEQQAAERLKDWDEMRQRAEAAEQRGRELEADAARYRFLRDVPWLDTPLERIIALQSNALWDAAIDSARGVGGEG